MLGFTTPRGIASGSISSIEWAAGKLSFESWSNDLRLSVGAHMRTVELGS
jgi:hypothetical protein